jgi:hypothetical protein
MADHHQISRGKRHENDNVMQWLIGCREMVVCSRRLFNQSCSLFEMQRTGDNGFSSVVQWDFIALIGLFHKHYHQ